MYRVWETLHEGAAPLAYLRSRLPRVLSEGISVIIGKTAVALAGLVGVRVLTELAPPSIYGAVALLLGIVSLGRSVFLGPVANSQLRYDPEHARRGSLSSFTREIHRYAWIATALFILTGCGVYGLWATVLSEPLRPLVLGLLVTLTCVQTAKIVRVNRLNAARKQAWSFGWQGTEAWLLVLFPAAAMILRPSIDSYLAGIVAASLMGLVVFGRRHASFDPEHHAATVDRLKVRKSVVRYGVPFIPLALFSWTHNLGDRYLLGAFLGADKVGLYAAAYGIASQPFILLGSAGTSLLRPILFEATAQGQVSKARRVFRAWLTSTGFAGILGVALLTVMERWIAHTFLAASYREAAQEIMIWIGAGYALMIVGQVLEHGLMVRERSSHMVLPAACAAVANVGLNLLLIPKLGVVGAAMATTAAFALQVILLGGWLAAIGVHRSPDDGESDDPSGTSQLLEL